MHRPTLPPEDPHYSLVSCPNAGCHLGGQRGADNLVHRSWTGKDQHIARLRCQAWGQEFSERRGTLLAGSTRPEETVERLRKCQRWGVCDAGTADICRVDITTGHRFQTVAAPRAQAPHEQVPCALPAEGVQLDERPSKRRGPRVEWRHTASARRRRCVLWGKWGSRTQARAARLIAQVVARLCGLPVWLSDGWKAYPAALWHVLGRVSQRRRRGTRGRHPQPSLVPPHALFYAQVVKGRDGAGTRLHVVPRVVYGGPRRFVLEMAGRGLRPSIQTACMERWDGTLRGLCGPPAAPPPLPLCEPAPAPGTKLVGGRSRHLCVAAEEPAPPGPAAYPSAGCWTGCAGVE